MHKAILTTLTLSLLSVPFTVSSACIGSGSFYTCNDASGNSYSVNKFGNSTIVNGYNSKTGSSWSQNSYDYGNTTITNGRASNGNNWNSTTYDYGNGVSNTYGTDSNGNSFNSTCTAYGCY